ncbi:hypothetical protein LX32DRAFT_658372 [Colletotrichum zoysiae]|uniref:Uncharacterized protein n=1 Tax=Colletotrichum zoysiae TaxID=1216348 RepID=A0AAD9LX63_9PEZI|nr:hypothetical protein LX32DRAFT_658372 [Colletotrichum zoysiae]
MITFSTPSMETPFFASRLSEGSFQMRDIRSLSVWSVLYRRVSESRVGDRHGLFERFPGVDALEDRLRSREVDGPLREGPLLECPRTRAPDRIFDVRVISSHEPAGQRLPRPFLDPVHQNPLRPLYSVTDFHPRPQRAYGALVDHVEAEASVGDVVRRHAGDETVVGDPPPRHPAKGGSRSLLPAPTLHRPWTLIRTGLEGSPRRDSSSMKSTCRHMSQRYAGLSSGRASGRTSGDAMNHSTSTVASDDLVGPHHGDPLEVLVGKVIVIDIAIPPRREAPPLWPSSWLLAAS